VAFSDDPEYLRMRAAEMRARADRAAFPETKQGLSRIADDFDLLANRAEQRAAVNSRLANRPDEPESADSVVSDEKVSPEATEDATINELPPDPSDLSEGHLEQ
jgi:hypothetical protein